MWYMASFSYAAGYLHIIEQMKDLIKAAGKKSYTLVMGRPNSTKLANFPEVLLSSNMFSLLFMLRITDSPFFFFFFLVCQCEVFVYVSCAQTALLDSKDFLAPVITPFEAVLAFSRYTPLLPPIVLLTYLCCSFINHDFILSCVWWSGLMWMQVRRFFLTFLLSSITFITFSGEGNGQESIF